MKMRDLGKVRSPTQKQYGRCEKRLALKERAGAI
jgi:hypothetical protein